MNRHTSMAHEIIAVTREAEDAQIRYGDFASMHEALGVLLEEFDELKEAVYLKQEDKTRAARIYHEAVQVSAVAMRMAEHAGRVTR